MRGIPGFNFFFGGGSMGDMQLVALSQGLGQYFGTDKGLLVVRAPQDSKWQLKDGDVIVAIGGRDPGTPPHAMRILGSYGAGESVKLDIMRKGRPLSLSISLPKAKDDSMDDAFNLTVPDTDDDDDGADGR
jgi:S1-C subfamily serine protease